MYLKEMPARALRKKAAPTLAENVEPAARKKTGPASKKKAGLALRKNGAPATKEKAAPALKQKVCRNCAAGKHLCLKWLNGNRACLKELCPCVVDGCEGAQVKSHSVPN